MTRPTTLSTLLYKYQSHLDDSATHAIHKGISTRKIHTFHQLSLTTVSLPDQRKAHLIIPARLMQKSDVSRIEAGSRAILPVKAARHLRRYPMLSGILLSECERLHLEVLSDNLQQLFDRENDPGIREMLTLLCWSELLDGLSYREWTSLADKTDRQIQGWIKTRLRNQPARRAMIDEYVFFSCFGYWADYRPA
ncbi:hypothetical protein BV924_01065 [Pectobacterium odoriferum]|uniref:Uncharacterized protein n=1 Tax=Pectobacterium odoriferum TaxID=78398 RepID=A0ABD6VVL1_9GAMM|nr:hypothetical protein [Pectobacterium odoriferum]POE15399.1 hypothetical protein BV924_01065 [Pectobacterium odoriferum]POE28938.1 hypothetical protein BV926_01065 [Pectobacterium odoriferum]POE34285.1 hypothetical protein BV919_01065 [Pectobacterium odoriferum]